MIEEKINKEKKQLLLFSKFKKIGILCLSIGGGLVVLSFLLLIIFIIAGSEGGAAFSEILMYIGALGLEIGLPATIVFSIFVKRKCVNIYNYEKQVQ